MAVYAFLFVLEILRRSYTMSETINREDLYLFQTGKARQAYLTFGCQLLESTRPPNEG